MHGTNNIKTTFCCFVLSRILEMKVLSGIQAGPSSRAV